jgi:dTDP-4-amino-4,6-dideoxygalactose transaminase
MSIQTTATETPVKAGRRVPLLDLQAQYATIRNEVLQALTRVADSQKFILGEDVEVLERQLASYCQVEYAIGCASGSDALMLALMAHDIGPGDEVLTVSYTFFATAGAIHRLGARPVFVDVDPVTFNLSVEQAAQTLQANPRIKAILPVHLFGACVDMDPLCELAGKYGIPVIEDAAQSIGAEYKGRRAGSLGTSGCFSFFPSKNLGAFGDGGLVTTNDAGLAARLKALRIHGRTGKYFHEWVGVNSRLDALQAAVLQVKLRHLDAWTAGRRRNAELYRKLFAERNVPVTAPQSASYQTRHIYNQFVIRCSRRDELQKHLKDNAVGNEIYYPLPLHLQPCFAGLGYKAGDFPVSEDLAKATLALPIYAELAPADIEYVVDLIQSFYA